MISLIIPIFNSEKTIRKCLDSIINQTYRDLEIILIDDGSSDSSYKICEEYQKRDNRIVLLHQQNSGVSKARNYGLDVARGQYIGFVDSDDYIDNNMYEILVNEMVNSDCKISICNYYFENENGVQIRSLNNRNLIFSSREYPQQMFNNLSINGFLCNKLYDKDLIYTDDVHLKLDEDISTLEDNLFNYEIFDNNTEFMCSYISDKLYHYVQYKDSACNNKYNYKNLQYFIVRDNQINILKKRNIDYNYLMADYIINFVKAKIKFRLLNINKNSLFLSLSSNYDKYVESVNISDLSMRTRIKYIISRWFSFIYLAYILIKKENI